MELLLVGFVPTECLFVVISARGLRGQEALREAHVPGCSAPETSRCGVLVSGDSGRGGPALDVPRGACSLGCHAGDVFVRRARALEVMIAEPFLDVMRVDFVILELEFHF